MATRPNDINGNPVDCGKTWYWARDRRGNVCGAGKFAWVIGQDDATFFINGTGYDPSGWQFWPATDADEVAELREKLATAQAEIERLRAELSTDRRAVLAWKAIQNRGGCVVIDKGPHWFALFASGASVGKPANGPMAAVLAADEALRAMEGGK